MCYCVGYNDLCVNGYALSTNQIFRLNVFQQMVCQMTVHRAVEQKMK